MGLLAGEHDLAGVVLHPFEEDFDLVAGFRLGLVLPLVERHQTFGLVSHIDDDLVAHDLDDPARNDGPDLEALAFAQEVVEGLGAVLGSDDRRQLVFVDVKFT